MRNAHEVTTNVCMERTRGSHVARVVSDMAGEGGSSDEPNIGSRCDWGFVRLESYASLNQIKQIMALFSLP